LQRTCSKHARARGSGKFYAAMENLQIAVGDVRRGLHTRPNQPLRVRRRL